MTDHTQRICLIMFWALVIFSILLKNFGAYEQNVVDLQSGDQIRVLPLLNIHNINASIYQYCHGKWFDIILYAFWLTFIAAGISKL